MKVRISLLIISVIFLSFCNAQSVEEQLTIRKPDCRDVMMNSTATLSRLYTDRLFDSIQVALDVMRRYCDPGNYRVIYISTLLDIEQSSFKISSLDSNDRIYLLFREYPFALLSTKRSRGRFNRYHYYFLDDSERDFYLLSQKWASDLLNRPNLSSNERFICNVLAGKIIKPEAKLREDRSENPELFTLYRNYNYQSRLQGQLIRNFMIGTWIPTGHLKIVGVHPSFGIQLGGKMKRTEIDITMQGRLIGTPNDYTVLRHDSLYSLRNYFGAYLGLDYTRYLFQGSQFEAGITGGVGYDSFDISGGNNDAEKNDYLKPYEIGSLNLNAGLRLTYFFNSHFSLGLLIKYNYMDYQNKGGSSLKGNAFSMDVIFGH